MLTAFTYYDPEEEDRIQRGMKGSPFFEREREMARAFALAHPHHRTEAGTCPACGGRQVAPFFATWGIRYYRCAACGTIFDNVTPAEAQAYFSQPELQKLRISDAYQDAAAKSREQRWQDLIDWIAFRAFRYLGRNTGLSVLDYGNRWRGFSEMLRTSDFTGTYTLRDSLLSPDAPCGSADIVLALNYTERCTEPHTFLEEVRGNLAKDGLFIFSIKAGHGFDILTLRENNRSILPYEHNFLPSRDGIATLLDAAGFELLEYTSPGTFDFNYVKAHKDGLGGSNYFMRYFIEHATANAQAEFQRFLQRSGMSSYAQLIARRRD